MRNALIAWILLRIHKGGLCEPLHWKASDNHHLEGWCIVLQATYDLVNSITIKNGKAILTNNKK